ncbi:MAG: SEC-C domain-containing protein [Acidobacteriota bacterium]|nr:SEC-C domain-containing protein [Acidobacteriota bacterium]
MPTPGRNDPCPCGSGRKLKHCCGNAALPIAGRPTAADRSAGYDLLDRISSLPRFADDVSLAFALIWQGIPHVDVDRLMETPARDLFLEWVWFDFQLHTGHTIADFALERHAADVGPGARQFLRATAAAPLRVLQVAKVEPGACVHVRDVVDKGSPIIVSERRGSEQLVRHEVIVGRIVDYGTERQFEGAMLTVPVADKTAMAAAVRRGRRQTFRALRAGEEPAALLRMASGGAIVMEVVDLFDRPQPTVTVDGDEIAFAETIFSVLDADAARAALDASPQLEPEEEPPSEPDELARYAWLEQPHQAGGGPTRILGAVVLGRKSLRVEVLSMPRARLAHAWFSSLVPKKAVRFKAIQVKSREAAAEAARSRTGPSQPELPPEIVSQIQREYYERHYREWLDIPVPALGHRTPREAAGVKKLRAKLVALVESIEIQAARQAKEGEGFDASFLRTELGLRSP